MTKIGKNLYPALGLLAVLPSCVDRDYDLTGQIDMDMNVGGRIEMPLPGKVQSYSYSLGDILLTDDGNGGVQKHEDGSLWFAMDSDSDVNETYAFGDIEIDNFSKSDSHTCYASEWAVGKEVNYPMTFQIGLDVTGIDECVEKIRKATLDAVLKLRLDVPQEVGVTLEAGYKFMLPEFMFVDESTLPSFAEIGATDLGLRNVVVLKEAVQMSPSFTIECRMNEMDLSSFTISGGSMKMSGMASASGKMKIDKMGLKTGEKFDFRAVMSISDAVAKSVEIKASPSMTAPSREILTGDMPEALTDGSIGFTLADLGFIVNANNGTPFDVAVSAAVSSWKGGQQTASADVRFSAAANSGEKEYCLSESGEYGNGNVTKIKTPGLVGLVSPIPEKFVISDIKADGSAGGDGYVTVTVGQEYSMGFSCSIEAPLAFSSLSLRRDEKISVDVDFGNDVGFDDLYIKADVTSTLPLDARLSCTFTDSEGNVMPGVTVKPVDGDGNELQYLDLPAGGLDTPSVKELRLKAVAEAGNHISSLSGLMLHIEADSPEGKTAVLNADQSLTVSGIIIGTDSGIFISAGKKDEQN